MFYYIFHLLCELISIEKPIERIEPQKDVTSAILKSLIQWRYTAAKQRLYNFILSDFFFNLL